MEDIVLSVINQALDGNIHVLTVWGKFKLLTTLKSMAEVTRSQNGE